jgi:hypothetical protein
MGSTGIVAGRKARSGVGKGLGLSGLARIRYDLQCVRAVTFGSRYESEAVLGYLAAHLDP